MKIRITPPQIHIESNTKKPKRLFVDNLIPPSILYSASKHSYKKKENTFPQKNVRIFPPVARAFLAAVVILGLFIKVHPFGDTSSYFNDTELSQDNKFMAGSVFFNIQSVAEEQPLGRLSLAAAALPTDKSEGPGVGETNFNLSLDSGSSLAVDFTAEGELDKDNPTGCEGLNLDFDWGDAHYSGPVSAFIQTDISVNDTGHFKISIPPSSVLESDAICRGNIIFKSFLENEKDGEKTYNDEKKYPFEVKNSTIAPIEITPPSQTEVITEPESPSDDTPVPPTEEVPQTLPIEESSTVDTSTLQTVIDEPVTEPNPPVETTQETSQPSSTEEPSL